MTQLAQFPFLLQNGPGNTPDADQVMANWNHIRDYINAGLIGTTELENLSVTTAKLANDSVTTAKIAPNAVTAAEIAADAVGASEIANGSIGSGHIVSGAVGSAQIADLSIGSNDIAGNAVTASKIAPNAVGASEIASNAVTGDELNQNVQTAATSVGAVGTSFGDVTGLSFVANEAGSYLILGSVMADTSVSMRFVHGVVIGQTVGPVQSNAGITNAVQAFLNDTASIKIQAAGVTSGNITEGWLSIIRFN